MPELRKGVRRGRAGTLAATAPPAGAPATNPTVGRNRVKTRAAIAREEAAAQRERPRTRLAAKKLEQQEHHHQEEKDNHQQQQVIVISEKDNSQLERKVEKGKQEINNNNNKKMGDDSGGLSANKAVGQEEEGSTAPFPERVCFLFGSVIGCLRDFVNWVGVITIVL